LLLGRGDDMHVAALCPGAQGLSPALAHKAGPVAVIRPPGQPEARISLSAPMLTGALSVHLLIRGAAKRAALERARSLPPEEAPVRLILDTATIHWSE
jgi:6-phosphogluconolactonase